MAEIQLNYSNTAVPQLFTAACGATDTTITVGSTTTYPAAPFLIGADRGTSSAEVMLCTSITSATQFAVTRGYDGTTAVAHSVNTGTVEHCSTAISFAQPNAFINLLTTPGDLLGFGGTNPARVPVGGNHTALVADSTQTDGVRWGTDLLLGSWNQTLTANTASGAAATFDLSLSREFSLTLTANCAITFANTPALTPTRILFEVALVQDATGSRTVTWPASVTWANGVPTLSTAAGAEDYLRFISDNNGTSWLGFSTGPALARSINASVVTTPDSIVPQSVEFWMSI